MGYTVAIVGATGAVGIQMIRQLEQSNLPIEQVKLLSSSRSAGKILHFKDEAIRVEETTKESFYDVDIALFSAGGSISAKFAPYAVKSGAVVVDNTSYFRQNPDVPLVVPEVNAHAMTGHNGIIACPNCSTIQMMIALEPIRQKWGIERVIVSTYQAVSGSGARAVEETKEQLRQVLNDNLLPD
ncbi:TPA: aspartate-semialdehyde dehydrogenase, partial [Streptococcus agalactiae]|nr:aspartate-semialdehyde dehydrogenase [Streptococcus agalactiae]